MTVNYQIKFATKVSIHQPRLQRLELRTGVCLNDIRSFNPLAPFIEARTFSPCPPNALLEFQSTSPVYRGQNVLWSMLLSQLVFQSTSPVYRGQNLPWAKHILAKLSFNPLAPFIEARTAAVAFSKVASVGFNPLAPFIEARTCGNNHIIFNDTFQSTSPVYRGQNFC